MKFSTLLAANMRLQRDRLIAASSISGFKFALIAESRVTRCLWRLNCFALLSIALNIMFNIWRKNNENPTHTVLQTTEYGAPINFPSVFICPQDAIDDGKRKQFVADFKAKFNVTLPDKQISDCITIYSEFRLAETNVLKECKVVEEILELNMLEKELLDLFPNVSNSFRDGTLKNDPINCESLIEAHFTETGYCFVLNNAFLKNTQKSLQAGWNIIELYEYERQRECHFKMITWNNQVEIYLKDVHGPTTFREFSDFFGTMLFHGEYFDFPFIVEASNYENDIRKLSKRTCYFRDEVFAYGRFEQHINQSIYQQNICYNICHAVEFFKRCNCVPKFYKNFFPNLTHPSCKLRNLECCQQNFDSIRYADCGICVKNCNSIVYDHYKELNQDVIYSTKDITHSGDFFSVRISLDFWPLLYFRTIVLKDLCSLLVTIGGVADLMLGFNIMILVEWIYQFTLRLFFAFQTDGQAIRQKTHEHKNLKPPYIYLGWRTKKNLTK